MQPVGDLAQKRGLSSLTPAPPISTVAASPLPRLPPHLSHSQLLAGFSPSQMLAGNNWTGIFSVDTLNVKEGAGRFDAIEVLTKEPLAIVLGQRFVC